MSTAIGYAWIQEALQAPDFLGAHKARLGAVQSLQRLPEGALLVPAKLAPGTGWLDHALFAIKHEGVRLDYLTAALRQVSPEEMEAEFLLTPNGTYVRKLCLLWEAAHQRSLPAVDTQPVAAAYVPTSSGKAIPLLQIAQPVFAWEPGVLWRDARSYAITVQGDVREGL